MGICACACAYGMNVWKIGNIFSIVHLTLYEYYSTYCIKRRVLRYMSMGALEVKLISSQENLAEKSHIEPLKNTFTHTADTKLYIVRGFNYEYMYTVHTYHRNHRATIGIIVSLL